LIAAPSDNPFVGRARELSTLGAALAAARSDSAPVVAIQGEPGIGKTRTVREFAQRARQEDIPVLWGTCFEGGVGKPYAPWAEALGPEGWPDGDVPGSAGAGAATASLPPDQSRLLLFEAVLRTLGASAEPRVLVLDDLHWADRDTLALLRHVVRFASPRLLMVLVFRSAGLGLDHPLAHALGEVWRLRRGEQLALASLSDNEAAELLGSAARRALEPGLVDAILRDSGGNPFFLVELGRELHDRAGLQPGAMGWQRPDSIRRAIGLRLAGLSAQGRQMIELASVFTAGFAFAEMEALSGLDEETLLDCLDEALAADLLRPVRAERYDFAHALVRHTLYERFSPSRRARLHRRVATVLEERYDGREAVLAREIARQFYASRTLPGAARGVEFALAAAEHSRAASALGERVTFLGYALELVPASDIAMRGEIAAQLAIVQAEATMLADAPAALERALALLEEADAGPDAMADVVYRAVAALQDALADQDKLDGLIARGLQALGEARGLTWARLKLLERPRERVAAGALDAQRWLGFDPEAVRIARELGDESDYGRSLEHLDPWQPSELVAVARRVRTWSDPLARLRGLDVAVQSLSCLHGVTPETDELAIEYAALAEATGSLPALALASTYRCAVLAATGDLARAAARYADARALAERIPLAGRLRAAVALVGEVASADITPDWADVAERMSAHAARPEQVLWFRLALAASACRALVKARRGGEAQGLLADVVAGISNGAPWDYGHNCAVCLAGEAVADLGRADLAAQVLGPCLELIEQQVGNYLMTSSELTAARLLRTLGRDEDALPHFARAREDLDRRRQPALRAIVDYEEGTLRARLGASGADVLVGRATAQFAALGMQRWIRAAASGPGAPAPDGLTPRELEILRALGAGKTNNEIAAELFLSVHTVERHVHNAYRKIGARNRADATAYVVRLDL
jgi:DNA-binding CsgD family transcriptional regulator